MTYNPNFTKGAQKTQANPHNNPEDQESVPKTGLIRINRPAVVSLRKEDICEDDPSTGKVIIHLPEPCVKIKQEPDGRWYQVTEIPTWWLDEVSDCTWEMWQFSMHWSWKYGFPIPKNQEDKPPCFGVCFNPWGIHRTRNCYLRHDGYLTGKFHEEPGIGQVPNTLCLDCLEIQEIYLKKRKWWSLILPEPETY